MKKILAVLMSVAVIFAVAAFSASAADADVAAIGEATYATLADAIADATSGDTIKLLDDVTENVTIGKNLIIDGDDNDFTGKMSISKSIALTVEDVNFVEGNVVKPKSTGTSGTYTFKDCSFFSETNSVYAVEIRGSGSIVIEDCTSDGYFGFLQVPSSNNSTSIKNVTIKNTGYAIKVDYSNGVALENVTVTDSTYGFVNSNFGEKTIAVKDCTVKANYPIVIWDRNTKKVNTFKFEGKNDFGANGLYYNAVTEDEKAYTKFVLADAASTWTAVEGLDVTNADYSVSYADGTYLVMPVAQIGEVKYVSLKDAVAAATDGDTVTILADHEIASKAAFLSEDYPEYYVFAEVIGKKVTIDLNGKVITTNPELDNMLLAVIFAGTDGEVVLKDSSEAQTGAINVNVAEATKSYSIFTVDSGKFTIESGNYYLNRADAWSMIYAANGKEFTVTGGNFVLGNGDTKTWENGETYPWIANVGGDGAGAIEISGGTYNIDPEHYHGETYFPGCYAPVEEEDKWVVKIVHTPGDAATCQAAQICTACGVELDAIKEHTFGEYVSDNNATCEADGTKTAQCIYNCGTTDTVIDEGTMGEHADVDGNGNCDGCNAEICDTCGKVHKSWINALFCLIVDFVRLVLSFASSVK